RLAGNPVPIQMPYGEGDEYKGIVDLMSMELVTYGDDMGTSIERHPVPEGHRKQAETRRQDMIEKIVEIDDVLTEKYLMEEELTDDELLAALRAATIASKLQLVLCGSALKNKGVQMMLDRVVDLLTSPLDIPAVRGTHPKTEEELVREPSDDEPTT